LAALLTITPVAVVAGSPGTALAASPGIDTPGAVRNANWYLSNSFGGNGDHIFVYGNAGDIAIAGDWNGDGIDTPGVFRNATWYLSNGYNGSVDYSFVYGLPGDIPVVGDWNGDGRDTVGIMRGDQWHLSDSLGGGVDYAFAYGIAGDKVVVGDWNGDGRDTPGVVRGHTWFLSNSFGGTGDYIFGFGNDSDLAVAGDWDANGTDTPGLVRGDEWWLSNDFSGGVAIFFKYGIAGDQMLVGHWGATAPPPPPPPPPTVGVDGPAAVRGNAWYLSEEFGGTGDYIFTYGNPTDIKIVGDWDGDGIDTPGVVRGNTWYLSNGYNGTVAYAFSYGLAGDIPVVGDWNGDGLDSVGVMRGDRWFLSDTLSGPATYNFAYGIAGDLPVVGDWNGDGVDGPGVVRNANWYLSDSFGGTGDHIFVFGNPGDIVVAGDWDADGIDTPGVVRGDAWFLSDSFGGNGDHNFAYGIAGDRMLAGHFGTPEAAQGPPPSGCPFTARIVTYNPDGWGTLLDALGANQTACAQYYITLPSITNPGDPNNKLFPRGGTALTGVRAKGANFHPVAEFHYQTWATVTNMTWFQKGVEFRRRMTAAGYDQSRQETWAVNELPSTVRTNPTVRQNVMDLVRGLYQGPSGVALGGAVFVVNFGHINPIPPNTTLGPYKSALKGWETDGAFWTAMNSHVRWWGQEVYTSCSKVCVPGATVGTKSSNVNAFIEHPAKLAFARGAPAAAGPARNFFNESYMPLTTGFWQSSEYGDTRLPLDTMKALASLQVYAARAWAGNHVYPDGRFAIAWNEQAGTVDQRADLASRIAAAIAGAYGSGGTAARACSPTGSLAGCNANLSGARFNKAWRTFDTW